MYFQNKGHQKTLLVKYIKNRVSEDASRDKVTNALKHCCNLNESTFGALNFGNTSAMILILFWKKFKRRKKNFKNAKEE